MEQKSVRLWRYILLQEVDRIFERSLNPTIIYFIEKVYPEDYTKTQILNELNDYELNWKQSVKGIDFYFTRILCRIDITKRHKNAWEINRIALSKRENNKGLKSKIYYTSPSIFANEAIAHAFGLSYFENIEDTYPTAGIVSDLFVNIEVKERSRKDEKVKVKTFQELDIESVEKRKAKKIHLPIKAYQGNDSFIFISYSHKDKEVVYPEIDWLNNQGFNIWYDEGIPPTTIWERILPEKIFISSCFIVFISKNAVASGNVNREISYAIKHNKRTLPIYIEDAELPKDLEFLLQRIQAIMKYQISESSYKTKLLETLKKNIVP